MVKANGQIDYTEFLELAKLMTAEQYEDNCTDYHEMLTRGEEMQEYKKPEKIIDPTSSTNLTQVKRDKLRGAIESSGNLEIGKFVVKIRRKVGRFEKEKTIDGHLNISLYQRGDNGIHQRVQPMTDFRFREAEWLEYFKNDMTAGDSVPIETVVEIVRWLQVAEKMTYLL